MALDDLHSGESRQEAVDKAALALGGLTTLALVWLP